MIITCPNCSTKYNLPDDKIGSNSKLRCTVCKHIFAVPASENPENPEDLDVYREEREISDQDEGAKEGISFSSTLDSFDMPTPPYKRKKSSLFSIVFILIIVLAGATYAVYRYTPLLDSFKPAPEEIAASVQDQETKMIYLRGVRQYNITNEKLGKLSVIEGKAINGFDVAKELIKLEAVLYDNERNVLVAKQQLAGTSVSLFQLQVLSAQELDQALGNKIDILANNTNVAPGVEVPFMIVFFNPPENASEFGVRVIEARTVPKK